MDRSNKEELQQKYLLTMLKPAQEKLKKYSIETLCKKAAITFDEAAQDFIVPSLGMELRVHYPDFTIDRALDMWHYLTILQYMDTADGCPLTDKWISLSEMSGGLSRGYGFNKDISTMFQRNFGNISPEHFARACRKAGGRIQPGKSDVSAVIPYAPMFPVTVNFWASDEEFPASGKVLVNEKAEHYLTIEAAGGACSAVVTEISRHL
ncbi:MAG: DUF3786 domain-containing protein [Bilifractor sp.]